MLNLPDDWGVSTGIHARVKKRQEFLESIARIADGGDFADITLTIAIVRRWQNIGVESGWMKVELFM